MQRLTDFPWFVLLVSVLATWLCAQLGAAVRRAHAARGRTAYEDLDTVLAASLTLLGLIIGFNFSISISRYDERKKYEEEEANAIGTEYLRAGLLPADDAAMARQLLGGYLNQRIQFFYTRDRAPLQKINERTTQLQQQMWSIVQSAAVRQPSALTALTASGMNDVLNSQGYTQAAWWNRIPRAAWLMMLLIAVCGNLLLGYGVRNPKREARLLIVLPLVVATSFLLIADIDSPHGGLIRVHPQNLESLAESLR